MKLSTINGQRKIFVIMRYIAILMLCIYVMDTQCKIIDGFIENPVDGHAYKIMYQAEPWIIAKKKCEDINAKLAVPKSDDEFKFIQKVVRGMHYPSIIGSEYKLLAWLGVSNLENYTRWMNVDGENIETSFHKWAKGNGDYSDNPAEPHCAGIDASNYGLRDFWCHLSQPYICETNV